MMGMSLVRYEKLRDTKLSTNHPEEDMNVSLAKFRRNTFSSFDISLKTAKVNLRVALEEKVRGSLKAAGFFLWRT